MKKIYLVLLLLSALVPPAASSDSQIVLHLTSYHTNRDAGYNEHNYGVGVRTMVGERTGLTAGAYNNSFDDFGAYVAASYDLYQGDAATFRVIGGLVSGYNDTILIMLLPEVGIPMGRSEVLIGFIPAAPDQTESSAVFTLSVGFRID